MKITLSNDWGSGVNLFDILWNYKSQWSFQLLGFTYYTKKEDDDYRSLFYHIIEGYFYGKGIGSKYEDYMFSIGLFGFGIIISWGKDSD